MKILFITKQDYEGVPNGGSAGSKRNYQLLSELGEVELYHIKSNKNFMAYFSLLFLFFPGVTLRHIQEIKHKCRTEHYSLIFLDASLFGCIAKHLKKTGFGKIIVFFHNCESDYFRMLAEKNRIKLFYFFYALHSERQSIKYADAIVTLNKRDQKRIEQKYNRKSEYIIPVTFENQVVLRGNPLNSDARKRHNILFVGSFFLPNYEGIKWFVEAVLPSLPANLQIVGKGFEIVKDELESKSKKVEVIGTVSSIEPYYLGASCVIMPIFDGAGMKVKTAEALMYGKSIFGTREAFEGYELDYHKAGGLCNTSDEFIDKIISYLENPVYFNEYNRTVFMKKYSNTSIRPLFKEMLGETLQ